MKCSRFYVATYTVDGESRPVHYLQFSNGESWFVFERTITCPNCEHGTVYGCDESYACEDCDRGVLKLDIDCDAIGNTEDSELYLPPITTRIDLEAIGKLVSISKVGVLVLAAALLASPVLASCDDTPLFFPPAIDGPTCTPANEEAQCQCSECLAWDSVDTPQRFEVQREDDAGAITVVGTAFTPIWCPGKDVPTVVEGRLYYYRVRACSVDSCSAWSTSSVSYRAAHYREFNQ